MSKCALMYTIREIALFYKSTIFYIYHHLITNVSIDYQSCHWKQPKNNRLLPIYSNLLLINDDFKMIEDLCNKLNILSLLNNMPEQLSGGERQRISIVRALLQSPILALIYSIMNQTVLSFNLFATSTIIGFLWVVYLMTAYSSINSFLQQPIIKLIAS